MLSQGHRLNGPRVRSVLEFGKLLKGKTGERLTFSDWRFSPIDSVPL